MQTTFNSALVWMRRDLRCADHAALFHALKSARQVWCVFVFDTAILDPLPRLDRRVAFIRDSLLQLDASLRQLAAQAGVARAPEVGLLVRHGLAVDEIPRLAHALGVQAVFTNHDDEPQSLERDAQVRGRLSDVGVALYTLKDHVVFERDEVLSAMERPYSVFTPYKRAWLQKLTPFYLQAYPVERYAAHLAPLGQPHAPIPTLRELGFDDPGALKIAPGVAGASALLDDFLLRMDRYDELRDFPGLKGPSYLSVHLRFGTISVRELARLAHARAQAGSPGAQVWLSELIWRDFYHQILAHHPRVVHSAFKPEYDAIKWERGPQAQAHLQAWCEGRTGYPLVDAAMRQLQETGYMHNRLRMVVASFLVKDLGIDWRQGEAHFARLLLDFDLAANNGGWQWAASSGCDAQPYFRIFNPTNQSEKFDPQGKFIRRYVPELATWPLAALHAPWRAKPHEQALWQEQARAQGLAPYPSAVISHEQARMATMERYAVVKSSPASKPTAARKRAPS